jgi:hypothetical protein
MAKPFWKQSAGISTPAPAGTATHAAAIAAIKARMGSSW